MKAAKARYDRQAQKDTERFSCVKTARAREILDSVAVSVGAVVTDAQS